METLYLNGSGDLEFDGQNNLKTITGSAEREQLVKIILSTNLAEWFLDARFGLDYFAILGEKPQNELIFRAALINSLEYGGGAGSAGAGSASGGRITDIENIEFDFDGNTRNLAISFTCTVDGERIDFSEELEV